MQDQKAQTSSTASTSSSTPRFYVPAVHIPAEAAKAGPVHKIHILGDDARSRFIAHALCSVYNSVELLGPRTMPKSRYRNVEHVPSQKYTPGHTVVKNAASSQKSKDQKSHIDELIVTGRGYEAVEAIKSVEHRVDEKTSILLMNDGMGVLEDVREEVFKDTEKEPTFILGHMNHSLHYNRKFDSVQQLKSGKTLLTEVPSLRGDGTLSLQQRPPMLETMQQLGRLRVTSTTYDDWLRFKLPSMIFTAVVEPVCVLLDLSYKGLLENKAARGMIKQLLGEIVLLAENLPEVQESAQILAYLRGSSIEKLCYKKIMAKASAPSDLLLRVNKGLGTDINYQNGYFLRRAKKLNLDMPMNSFMAQTVEAKLEEYLARRNAYIPVMEKSHASSEYQTARRTFSM